MKNIIFKIVLIVFLSLTMHSVVFSQKKKIVYLDTLQNPVGMSDQMSIISTARYKQYIDESDSLVSIIKCVPTTKTEYENILATTERNFMMREKLGQQSPKLEFTDIEGKKYNAETLRDKIIVMNFWFVSCGPCIAEMPELNQLLNRYKDNDKVVFISFAKNTKGQVNKFLTKNDFRFPVVLLTESYIKSFGVFTYPTSIIMDGKGKYAFASAGLGIGGVQILQRYLDTTLGKL